MGTIGRGLIKIDDYKRFGEIVDKLSDYCYCINYIPSTDFLIVTFHRKYTKDVSKIADIVWYKIKGGLVFAKIKWRK